MRQDFAGCNPNLGRRLRRLSDRELDDLERSLLELLPPSPEIDYAIRALKDASAWEASVSRPLPRQPIPRRPYVGPEPSPAAQETPLARPNLPGAAMNTPAPSVGVTNPVPKPDTEPEPDLTNVVPISEAVTVYGVRVASTKPFRPYGKAWNGGREL